MKKGKLIVIEGSDGSGKATQANLLVGHLRSRGHKIYSTDFPRYESFFGSLVGRYLDGEFGDVHEVNPYLASLPYAFDRLRVASEMHHHLDSGDYVISNRYTFSNIAFQSAKLSSRAREKYIKWNEKLEYEINGLPREDIVIFLYVSAKFNQALVDKKAKRNYTNKKRDIHERNKDYLHAASRQYLALCRRYKHVRKIDCIDKKGNLRTINDIHQEIVSLLGKEGLL